MRGPASVAQLLYRETDDGRDSRLLLAAQRRAMLPTEMGREGKPSKRDRREIARLRGRR
jgi:ribosome-associated heat shock protein Hsp15